MKNTIHEKDYKEIVSRIQSLKSDAERQWGSMNASEMIVHCTDPIREALGTRVTKPYNNWFYKTIGKFLIFYVIPFPKGKADSPIEYDVKRKGTAPVKFGDDKDILLKLLSNFYHTDATFNFSQHPMFGNLSRKEWGRLTYLHLDHHLTQFLG